MSVFDAVDAGDRALLEAMRAELASSMDDAAPAVKAQISGQLLKVVEALRALPAQEGSIADELARRREDRVATARKSAPASRQKRQRRV